jgi:hypothetical protein
MDAAAAIQLDRELNWMSAELLLGEALQIDVLS